MELKTRNITEKDWSMLCSWWEGHKWPIPNNDALPENGTGGILVEENNIPVIAGFIFKTNSKGCWLEFIISDPNYKKDRSIGGMGIGLSLVKTIINSYNGQVWLENRIIGDHTKGSNFIILLEQI